jgi:hypothetical protein
MQQFAAVRTREIYRSSNGDRWLLARDPETGRVFVRHEPNLPSGGEVADIEIGAFLLAAGNGPEKRSPAPDWNPGLGGPPRSRVARSFSGFQTFDYFLGETPNTLFPSNLDRREGTCLESAVDPLIPRPS